jgi:hypothetical protein
MRSFIAVVLTAVLMNGAVHAQGETIPRPLHAVQQSGSRLVRPVGRQPWRTFFATRISSFEG